MSVWSWKSCIGRILIVGMAALAAGWIIGYPGWVLLTTFVIYASWHVVQLTRLQIWLQHPERDPPKSYGAWAQIFDQVSALERQRSEQKQQYLSKITEFQTLTDAFPDATLVIGEDNEINAFNSAAGLLLDLKESRDIGRPVTKLLRSPEFAEWLAVHDEVDSRLEMQAQNNYSTWFEISMVSIGEHQRLIILHDISEVHHVEQIRRDFVTNISHELRTPLTVMLGYLELFQDRSASEMTAVIPRMHTQVVPMHSMLDDFLELSRLQGVDTQDQDEIVDVAGILLQLKEQAEEISRGGHNLRFDIDRQLKLSGNTSDLESAFRNLIVNALKYTPDGGVVTVSWFGSDDGPVMSVADTGIGIPSREIPRLTERFYRVGSDRGRKTGGTGLGLAIVKHVLNAHQARLEIESQYGVGSKFSCVFPQQRSRN